MSQTDWLKKLTIRGGGDIPISTQLADQIKWFAASGVLKPEEKLPSVRKLAQNLGINLHTVRAAYEKLESIGLIQTIQSKGSLIKPYDPLEHTKCFSNAATHTIGVLIPELKNPFYTEFLIGVNKVALKEQFVTLVYNTQTNLDRSDDAEINLISNNMLMAKGIEGLLVGLNISGKNAWGNEDESYFRKLPFPVVFVDRPEILRDVVNLDAEHAGWMATEHLISHGHRRIAIITGKTTIPTLNNCFKGYLRALDNYGVPLDKGLIKEVSDFSFLAGYRSCLELLKNRESLGGFTAIFAACDLLAVGTLKALDEHGLKVPEDIAIIGYNNIELSEYTNPPLTTIAAPIQELGVESAGMLIRRIHGEPKKQDNLVLPTTLVVRKSCGCVA